MTPIQKAADDYAVRLFGEKKRYYPEFEDAAIHFEAGVTFGRIGYAPVRLFGLSTEEIQEEWDRHLKDYG